jgi:nucleoside-diphosphate-sugar epimerase
MNIFITGGAGYIGSKLIKILLEKNYKVTIFDKLLFGGDHLLHFNSNKNFNFIKGDIRDKKSLKEAGIQKNDFVIHLASIVGYPACRLNPDLATSTNIDGTKNILELTNKSQNLIYASTGSNYGHQSKIVNENSKLNPLSLYAETKVINEKNIQNVDNFLIYRFATAFGSSPRMRLDLLVNDFAYKAITEGYLVVYEKNHQRSFIHVEDIARSLLFGIENFSNVKNDIYNVGDESMNYSKEDICNFIKSKLSKLYIHYAEFDKDMDQRNYIVSYDKINKKGFKTNINIENGLDELIKSFNFLTKKNAYSNV